MSASTDKLAKSETSGNSVFPASTSLLGVYGEPLFRILEQASSGYVLLDAQSRAQRWNDGYLRIFPWMAQGLKVGAPLNTVLQAAISAAPATTASTLSQIANGHQAVVTRQKNMAVVQVPSGRKIALSAHTLSASYTVITCKELVTETQDSDTLAFFDGQTNLPNRRLLLDRLSQAMIQSERTGWRGALLTIDMTSASNDSEARISDLAKDISQRILGCVRACDTVARIDSDHFVIMISDLSPDIELANLLVERLSERLQESLNSNYSFNGKTLALQVNIGATLFGPHSRSATELLNQAEVAMYRLRDEEACGLHFFNPEKHLQAPERIRMAQELREALRQGLFELHYQPQYSAAGDISALEALMRWRHPSRGLVPPSLFLSVAEENDIIVPLGLWSIRAACEQLAKWKSDADLSHLPVCVNVSNKQLLQPDFSEQVEEIISQTGADPALLMLELSTSSLHPSNATLHQTLSRLSAIGLRLSLDDFGISTSSQEVLRKLPLHQLKLAQTLVQRLGPNNASEAAVQAAISIAARNKVTLVATGVETLEQRALLVQHGCEHFMGYLFSAPVQASELKSLLQCQVRSTQQKVA